jgi:hypothetical protein
MESQQDKRENALKTVRLMASSAGKNSNRNSSRKKILSVQSAVSQTLDRKPPGASTRCAPCDPHECELPERAQIFTGCDRHAACGQNARMGGDVIRLAAVLPHRQT